jgi:hypothetical protein
MEFLIITNDPQEAKRWDEAGVDYVFVDLEMNGKRERQGGRNTVISGHVFEDVSTVRPYIKNAKLLVRINPLHADSGVEVDNVIRAGADVVMLPMFNSATDLEQVVRLVDGRCAILPLIETPQALQDIDKICQVEGIDSFHIGLNDLSIALELSFMFAVVENEQFINALVTLKSYGIRFGFGGVAKLGQGEMPAELILSQHRRLGSTRAILSRAFKEQVSFENSAEEVQAIRDYYSQLTPGSMAEDHMRFQTKLDLLGGVK